MPRSITPADLARLGENVTIVDVRRDAARMASGSTIPGALRIRAEAQETTPGLSGLPVVVFCVHGHEVSQDACRDLVAAGIDAWYLEGGFEGWRHLGLPTVSIEDEPR